MKHKKFSRKKLLIAVNISDPLDNERIEETSIKRLAERIEVSEHRLRRIVNGDYETDFLRSQSTGKLWQISYNFDYIVQVKPLFDFGSDDNADTIHQFTSAYKCCKFLGISRDTYYRRYAMQDIGMPCKMPVKDVFDRPWELTFLKEIKDVKEKEWRFKQNEDNKT